MRDDLERGWFGRKGMDMGEGLDENLANLYYGFPRASLVSVSCVEVWLIVIDPK